MEEELLKNPLFYSMGIEIVDPLSLMLGSSLLCHLFNYGSLDCSFSNKSIPSLLILNALLIVLIKSNILPFPIHNLQVIAPFVLIHTDVWQIAPTLSRLVTNTMSLLMSIIQVFKIYLDLFSSNEICSHAYILKVLQACPNSI